MFITENLRR